MAARLAAAAGLLAALAVAAGAFGAHGLANRLGARELELWSTASRYLGIAALGALAIAAYAGGPGAGRGLAGGWLVAAGGVLFAGAVYALALGAPRWLATAAPLGGLAMVLGFTLFALAALRHGAG
ncbi:MAG: DUF423 domain-containing protein [Thermoanaerobaculia bacterium]|nr:DUF423 domain-containing protein [Thermoanaerobaculia bacterium]